MYATTTKDYTNMYGGGGGSTDGQYTYVSSYGYIVFVHYILVFVNISFQPKKPKNIYLCIICSKDNLQII